MAKTDLQDRVREATDYLQRTLGTSVQIDGNQETKRTGLLPAYLDRSYQFYFGSVQGNPLVFAVAIQQETGTPARLKKDAKAIGNVLAVPVVFVVERLESYERLRLIQEKVAFVVPGKQLYIPFLVINLTETAPKVRLPKEEKLRPASQVILLYHLIKERLDDYNFQTIAQKTGYSPMTVRRAAEELATYQLARKEGKYEKFIYFGARGRDLWTKALPYLASPVKISYYIEQLPAGTMLQKAGIAALSDYTNLAPGAQTTYALYDANRKAFEKKLPPYSIQYFGGGEVQIEVWSYDPAVLSGKDRVDPLSLYLSLPSYKMDERTEQAKEELINTHVW